MFSVSCNHFFEYSANYWKGRLISFHGMMLCWLFRNRYVGIYFFILYTRYKVGIVTDEMMALPKTHFMIIGFLEARGVVAGMASGGMITKLLWVI